MAIAAKKDAKKNPSPRKPASKTSKKAPVDNGSAKGKAWTFPKNTLEDAIRIPKAIDEKFAGNPAPAPDLAKAVGFKLATDWRFTDLLRAANLYGLVTGSGEPPRDCRRLVGLSYAAMGILSMAAVAA